MEWRHSISQLLRDRVRCYRRSRSCGEGRHREGVPVDDEQAIQADCEATFQWLMRRYGDRLTADMVEGLRASVESVVKTVAAVRKVPLGNGDAPLLGFTPGPYRQGRQERQATPRTISRGNDSERAHE